MRNIRKRGISPVIATVILVAIAIVISIAAAFWMTGLLTSFTTYEKLTISASISKIGTPNKYNATIIITNDGTLTVYVQKILINGTDQTSLFSSSIPTSGISPGSNAIITLPSNRYLWLTPGRPVKITVVTSRGSYETQLTAP
jgi:flagellin-like protein